MADTLQSRRTEAQLHALVGVQREIRASDHNNRRKYLQDFTNAFRSYQSVIDREELGKDVAAADIVLIGDYHALPSAQRFAATLLDSALGCAIFTTLAKGEAWTTLELKLNFVRPISKDTGTVEAEGRIIHRGRTVATAEGTVKDRAGKLYAHASTTCMIFPAKD